LIGARKAARRPATDQQQSLLTKGLNHDAGQIGQQGAELITAGIVAQVDEVNASLTLPDLSADRPGFKHL